MQRSRTPPRRQPRHHHETFVTNTLTVPFVCATSRAAAHYLSEQNTPAENIATVITPYYAH